MMEEIGDKYFRILLQSSLLEEVKQWRRTCYKMHDLVHDFAKSVLNQDRYLALNSIESNAEDIIKKNSTSLRTLFLENSISGELLSKFKCLHVIKLSGEDVKVLPDSIGQLMHLRFLDISNSQITKLPKSLCKLYNLQTLRIKNDSLREEGLPKQMNNLISLTHLHYYDGDAKFQMPSEMGQLTRLQTLEFFNVGQEDGRSIEELGSLKYLKGSLKIENLGLVNGKEEAEGAKLFEKPDLHNLTLVWGSEDRKSDNCDKNVLEGLEPHPNLKELNIYYFMGDQFPRWFINLTTLVKLKFIFCKRCNELPALGQLPSLERLELRGLENIRSIGLSFYGISSDGGQVRKFFPALKYLSLEDMENLAEWKGRDEMRSTTDAAEGGLFPVLESLRFVNCKNLKELPQDVDKFQALRDFTISKCPKVNELGGGGGQKGSALTSLKKLTISCCDGLTSLPGEMSCASLEYLEVCDCPNFVSFPLDLGQTPSLKTLCLSECPKLMIADMPRGFVRLTSLSRLKIGPFSINETNEFDWSVLKSSSSSTLTHLGFSGLPHVESLPEQLQYLTSLTQLWLSDFGIEALPDWIGNLTSLEGLSLVDCEKLLHLPSEAAMERLTKLNFLNARNCPLLKERCKSQRGPEWPKISHLPFLRFS